MMVLRFSPMSLSNDLTTVRIWRPTKDRLDAICTATGMNLIRAMQALIEGWGMLDDDGRGLSIRASTSMRGSDGDGVARQVWPWTRDKLEEISRQTGMSFVRLVDAMTHGWGLLTVEQQRQAIAQSAPPATADRN
jgi:hypothetical protein